MSFLFLFLMGIIIGTASVVPGVSGSVIAVIFGIYDKAIEKLVNLFKDFKNNFFYLFILAIGIIIGTIWFGNIILFLYEKHESITKLAFIGLILGGIPYLFKEVKKKNQKISLKAIIITFIISFIIFIISKQTITYKVDYSFYKLFLSGFIYSFGKVIPGVSGSFLLIIIGMYNFVLQTVAHPITYGLYNIGKVIPFLLGLILGVLILIKIINKLLNKYFGITYSVIIGFVLGSVLALIPIINSINNLITGLIIMILCFLLSYLLLKSK